LTLAGKTVTLTDGLSIARASDLHLEAPRAHVDAKLARLSFDGRILRIVALPAD